jgi:hypothetical protein
LLIAREGWTEEESLGGFRAQQDLNQPFAPPLDSQPFVSDLRRHAGVAQW